MMAEEKVSELLAVTNDLVSYIGRYGGACRDCADNSGVCPMSGLPCADAGDAIRHVLSAINYGVANGYLPDPRTPTPVTEDVGAVGLLAVGDDGVLRLSFYEDGPPVSEGDELYASPPKADGPGEDGWQPIETAPKNGTRLLACWDINEPSYGVVWWEDGSWVEYDADNRVSDPTHWRPLPVSPSIKREA